MGWVFLNDFLDNVSGCELIALSSILAIMISQGLDSNEIGTLANFFSSLGDNLGIISNTSSSNSCSYNISKTI